MQLPPWASWALAAVVGVSIVACAPTPSPRPVETAGPSSPAATTTAPASTAPAASAPTSPSVTAAPSPSPSPTSTAAPLALDHLATVIAAKGLRLSRQPGDAKHTLPDLALPVGSAVFLADRRIDGVGVTWWAVQPDQTFGYGWIPAADAKGKPTLAPVDLACPPIDAPIDTAWFRVNDGRRALACFGGRALTVRGTGSCSLAALDPWVAGASFLPDGMLCNVDAALGLHGPIVDASKVSQDARTGMSSGRYEIRGHFDDPEARLCFTIPPGVSTSGPLQPSDPGAVVTCRELFVVTEMIPLGA